MGGTAQPIFDWRAHLGMAARQFGNGHPVDSLESLFGMGQKPAPPPPDPNKTPYIVNAQRQALKSFQDAAARRNSAPKRKSLYSGQ